MHADPLVQPSRRLGFGERWSLDARVRYLALAGVEMEFPADTSRIIEADYAPLTVSAASATGSDGHRSSRGAWAEIVVAGVLCSPAMTSPVPTVDSEPASPGSRWGLLVVVVALVPVLSVNANYLLSASADYIPDCFVYLEGCTSISATGRYGVSYWLFKAFMLPQAMLLVFFWRGIALRVPPPGRRDTVIIAGTIGAAFLVLYTVFLGSQGDIYRLMRRYGVFVFFLGTFIAQIAASRRLARRGGAQGPLRVQQALLALMGLLALAEVPLGTFGLQDDQAENVIEWNFSLLMQAWFATWLPVAARPSSAAHSGA